VLAKKSCDSIASASPIFYRSLGVVFVLANVSRLQQHSFVFKKDVVATSSVLMFDPWLPGLVF
jgi:hypothetical protein